MIQLDCAFFVCTKATKGGLPVTEQKKLIVPNEEEKIIQIEIKRLTSILEELERKKYELIIKESFKNKKLILK